MLAQQQNGNSTDPAAPAGQTPAAPPPTWKPGDPRPNDPSGLGPGWEIDPSHKDPNGQRWVNPATGDKVDWNPGTPGKPGFGGKDHWHDVEGTKAGDKHWLPGMVRQIWSEHKGAIVATGVVVVVVGAVALAPVTGGASLGALAFAP